MSEIAIFKDSDNFFELRSKVLINCLSVLLKELGWLGENRHLREAMPSVIDFFTLQDFLKTLTTLRYSYTRMKINLCNVDEHSKPCLFISDDWQLIFLITDVKEDKILIYDGINPEKNCIPKRNLSGQIYLFKPEEIDVVKSNHTTWFKEHLLKYTGLFSQTFFITGVLNVLALALPIFSMTIYDQVIGSNITSNLYALLIGISIAIVSVILLQKLQANILAYVGVKLNNDMSKSIFERLLFLQASYTESASLNAQISRIKDFDNVRDFFMSPLVTLLFDFPFVIIFLTVIALLGGNIVYVPLVMMGIFFAIFFPARNIIQNAIEKSAYLYNKKQELLLEILQNLRTLKYLSAEDIWYDRFRKLSAETATANFRLNLIITCVNTISDFLMMLAATAIVALGSLKVMVNQMTVGGLVAVMILVWRVLVPLKLYCSSQTKIKQLKSSVLQINNLMKLQPERDPKSIVNPIVILAGDIRFNKVSFRYQNALDPTLLGVSFTIKAGEVVAIVGRNGSGKSSIFKLLLDLYKPQSGNIYIDNQDIRQMDPYELRCAISYVPQEVQIIYGTIAQNLRFARATATDKELLEATQLAGIQEDILSLPQGFETKLTDYSISHLSASFLQRLALARAYLRKSPILLLDEPENFLDKKSDEIFLKAIEHFRGQTTILMITHRPSHLKIANKILLLHEGQVVMSGSNEQILARLPKEFLI